MDTVMVTAAITGAVATKENSPYLPTTWDEIVRAAVDAWNAGAAIVHLHARDQDGIPTQDTEVFRVLIDRIRSAGCDAVLNLSTGEAGGRARLDERIDCLKLNPEMATFDCGSLNFGDERVLQGPYSFLRRMAAVMKERAIVPEIEVFDSGMIDNAKRLMDEGLIAGPGIWQLCLGVRGGASADLDTVAYLLRRIPADAVWSLLGVGPHQLRVNLAALAYGGHIRTGLEDNLYYKKGELAKSSAQLVERAVRLAEEVGRLVASPSAARAILGIREEGRALTAR